MSKVGFLLGAISLLSPMWANAQDDMQYRLEVGVGAGMVNYEGDFNGNILSNGQFAVAALGRYVFDPYKALKLSVGYGKLKGSYHDVNTYYPSYGETSYSFSNSLVDMSLVFEYNFWAYGTGRDYRGSKRLVPYIFGGLGATYVSTGDKNVMTANVPIGVGMKYKMSERMNLGLAWNMHFSLSDELDGVKDPYGIKSSGIFKNSDAYSMLLLSVSYSFCAKCKNCNKE